MSTRQSPIRTFRQRNNLSAADLAKRLGISESTLRSYENGNRKLPAEFAVEVEKQTGIPRRELIPELFAA